MPKASTIGTKSEMIEFILEEEPDRNPATLKSLKVVQLESIIDSITTPSPKG